MEPQIGSQENLNNLPGSRAIQMGCPHCDKKYLVAMDSLTFGQARFQCSSCDAFFAINWFGAQAMNSLTPTNIKTILLEKPHKTKTCYHCAHVCDVEASECPACAVVFAKERNKVHVPQGIQDIELSPLWQDVISNYADEKKHRNFVQKSFDKDQLVFASHHYRVVLAANPSEPTALKMQKFIMNLAEIKPQVQKKPGAAFSKLKFNFYKITILLCFCCIAMGAFFDSLRPLIALGSSVLIFSLIVHHWITNSEI